MFVHLGERLRLLREYNDYTQEYVSIKMNIERPSYSNYELGKRTPSIEVIIDFADFYHVSLDDLLRRQDFTPYAATTENAQNADLSSDEKYLLIQYRQLNSIEKEYILKTISKKETI